MASRSPQENDSTYDPRHLLSELVEVQTALIAPEVTVRRQGTSHLYPRVGVTFIDLRSRAERNKEHSKRHEQIGTISHD